MTYIFANYSIIRHLNFQTNAFDLGIYTQISYLYSQLITPYSTIKHMPLLADHFEPILWIIAPIYRLFSTPIALLNIQAIFVSTSAIPLYLISDKIINNKFLSYIVVLSYLTSIGIVNAIKFDFHTTALAVLPLSLLLYAWFFKKMRLYWASLVFGFLIKEDVALLTAGFGLYQIISGNKKIGSITTIISILFFIIIKFFLMPFIWKGSDQGYISTSLLPLTSPIDLLFLFFTNPKIFIDILFNSPIKQRTIFELYQVYGFLPFLSPLSWLTVFPMLYARFSSTHEHFWGVLFHYNANLMPFLTISTVLVIKKWSLPTKPLMYLLLIILLITGLSPNSIIWESIHMKVNSDLQYKKTILLSLPLNTAVSAQSPLLPHLANRTKIYLYPDVLDANYIVLDKNLESYPIEKKELLTKIDEYQNSKQWKIYKQQGSIIIFKRTDKLLN